MSATTNLGVALTRCFYCLEGSDILLNTRLTTRDAAEVEEFNGKVISMHPCNKCQGLMQQGIIVISVKDGAFDGVEEEQREYNKVREDFEREGRFRHHGKQMLPFIPNPYRTGVWTVMSEDGFKRMKDHLGIDTSLALKKRWAFVEDVLLELGGLYQYLEETGQEVLWRKEQRELGKDPHAAAIEHIRKQRAAT